MPKLEECLGCGVRFKHHELTRHRYVEKCGLEFPIKASIEKTFLELEKQRKIAKEIRP